jgi:hypothetical protein
MAKSSGKLQKWIHLENDTYDGYFEPEIVHAFVLENRFKLMEKTASERHQTLQSRRSTSQS